MTRRALPALLAAAAVLAGCPRLDPMNRQPKAKAYEAAPGGGAALGMRTPPEGTVPFGKLPPLEVSTGLGADGKAVALAPLPVDAKALARGRTRFEIICAACHGVLGDGESQVAINMSLRRPPSLHQFRDVPDGHVYRVISEGFGLMPSYAAELTVEERWAIVAYVRALQLSQHATLEQVPPELRGKLEQEAR